VNVYDLGSPTLLGVTKENWVEPKLVGSFDGGSPICDIAVYKHTLAVSTLNGICFIDSFEE